jgi:hypothetical protein
MPITLNGSNITSNTLNGSAVTQENLNGSKVYPLEVTASPTIQSAKCEIIGGSKYIVFYVKNNDTSAATIYYGSSSSTPNNAGSLSSLGTTSQLDLGPYSGKGSMTIYVKAIASGKQESAIVSQTVSYTICGMEL